MKNYIEISCNTPIVVRKAFEHAPSSSSETTTFDYLDEHYDDNVFEKKTGNEYSARKWLDKKPRLNTKFVRKKGVVEERKDFFQSTETYSVYYNPHTVKLKCAIFSENLRKKTEPVTRSRRFTYPPLKDSSLICYLNTKDFTNDTKIKLESRETSCSFPEIESLTSLVNPPLKRSTMFQEAFLRVPEEIDKIENPPNQPCLYTRRRSYSQRYGVCPSPLLRDLCTPKKRSYTYSNVETSVRRSDSELATTSSPTFRRQASIKITSTRKYSKVGTSHKLRKRSALSFSNSRSVSQKQISHVNTCQNRQSDCSFEPMKNVSSNQVGYSTTCSRKLSVALGRKPSNINLPRKLVRRSSEPFLLDPTVLQNRCYRKQSSTRSGKRRQSATASLPSASKQKLHELAKDELLASLNVPPPPPYDSSPVDNDASDLDESFNDALQAQQKEKERKEMKRQRVMEEILETEKNYISCLETLDSVFKKQLEEQNIITVKDLCSLFPSQLNEIRISHTFFMHELQDRMNNNNWRGIVGDIFAKMTSATANLSEIYINYVNLFPKSISTLSKCTRSSHKFRKFLMDCNENPLVERLDLPSFLLSPVQRLPRYVLLLRELLKYTEEDHPDMYFITEAKKEMEGMISLLNSSIHSSMEFYSANERRRKKMARQLASKKIRKQRSQGEVARKVSKNQEAVVERKTLNDADLGYCSFSERKDETQDDEANGRTQSLNSSQCSVSCQSDERRMSNGALMRRRKDSQALSRNSLARKSWRRSLGAVFSNLWSARDEIAEDNGLETKPRSESARFLNINDSFETPSYDETDKIRARSRNLSRKNGIGHPQMTTCNNLDIKFHLTEDSEASLKCSHDDINRKVSISSSQSSDSTKTPTTIPNFKRGRLRGSAGPVFRSIFGRAKVQKALSWNELNLDDFNVGERKKRTISSLKFRLASSKDSINKCSSNIHSDSNLLSTTLKNDNESTEHQTFAAPEKTFLQPEDACPVASKKVSYEESSGKSPSKLSNDESKQTDAKIAYKKSSSKNSKDESKNVLTDSPNSANKEKKSLMKSFKKLIHKK